MRSRSVAAFALILLTAFTFGCNFAVARVYNACGLAHYEKREFDQAMACFNQAIRFNPGFAEAFTNRGLVYTELGDQNKAIADHDRAISINPRLAIAFNNRGYLSKRRLRERNR